MTLSQLALPMGGRGGGEFEYFIAKTPTGQQSTVDHWRKTNLNINKMLVLSWSIKGGVFKIRSYKRVSPVHLHWSIKGRVLKMRSHKRSGLSWGVPLGTDNNNNKKERKRKKKKANNCIYQWERSRNSPVHVGASSVVIPHSLHCVHLHQKF